MRLIIVRHTQAEHNIQQLMVAHRASHLTEAGKAQAEQIAKRLQSKHIDVAFSSPAKRARHTIEIILRYHPDVKLEINPLLRERTMGEMEGKTLREFIADAKRKGATWYEYRPSGGESLIEAQQRAQNFFQSIIDMYLGKTILIVAHSSFIRAFLTCLTKEHYDRQVLHLDNTGMSIIEVDDKGGHKVHLMNDISHLKEGDSR